MSKHTIVSITTACALAAVLTTGFVLSSRLLAHDHDDDKQKASPVGAWFGVARPCTPASGPAHPTVNQDVCQVACKTAACAPPTLPFNEVVMMPALFADGTVVATDFGSAGVSPPGFPIAGDGHSTALGNWALKGTTRIGNRRYDRYQSAFVWFQGRFPGEPYNNASPVGFFRGSIRPRFVTFFDARDPDTMIGFLQPYSYNYTDPNGQVLLQPHTPFPDPDPIAPLPTRCDPTDFAAKPYCFGTFQFTIRRVPAQ
jgi:hypothetical protein